MVKKNIFSMPGRGRSSKKRDRPDSGNGAGAGDGSGDRDDSGNGAGTGDKSGDRDDSGDVAGAGDKSGDKSGDRKGPGRTQKPEDQKLVAYTIKLYPNEMAEAVTMGILLSMNRRELFLHLMELNKGNHHSTPEKRAGKESEMRGTQRLPSPIPRAGGAGEKIFIFMPRD